MNTGENAKITPLHPATRRYDQIKKPTSISGTSGTTPRKHCSKAKNASGTSWNQWNQKTPRQQAAGNKEHLDAAKP